MAKARKAAAYSKKRFVPYTRQSKKKNKSFVKTVPNSVVVKFDMGNIKSYNRGDFPVTLSVIAKEDVQIRDTAIESCRQFVNKKLETNYAKQYFFRICVHPHHIQRENKMLTGAGSDRMQTGMQLAFGKTVGRAAIVKKDKPIFFIALPNKKAETFTRNVLKLIKPKLPAKVKIISETVKSQ